MVEMSGANFPDVCKMKKVSSNEKGFFSFAGEKAGGGGVWCWRREIDETAH
jgi:hypothetical protein